MVLALAGGLQEGLSPLAKRSSRPFGPREGELALRLGDVPEVDQEQAEVEADGLGVREAARERAEPGESPGRPFLVVEADGRGCERLRVVRRGGGGGGELALGRDRAQRLLEGRAAKQMALRNDACSGERRDEGRQPRR